jgi:hypothetical protein
VEVGDELAGEVHLHALRVLRAGGDGGLQRVDVVREEVRQERPPGPHHVVRDGHDLPEDLVGSLVDADVVPERLRHLLDAVEADEERGRHDALGGESVAPHQLTADEEVEELVGAAELDVGL